MINLNSVNSCNFTNRANLHTTKVEYIQQKIMQFWPLCCEGEAILSKRFRPDYPGWSVHMGEFSSRLPRSRSQKPRSR